MWAAGRVESGFSSSSSLSEESNLKSSRGLMGKRWTDLSKGQSEPDNRRSQQKKDGIKLNEPRSGALSASRAAGAIVFHYEPFFFLNMT